MCGHCALNLLVLRSPQLSFTFGPYVYAGMDLYRRYAASRLQAIKVSDAISVKHWSGGRWVCRTSSTAPVMLDVVVGHSIINF